MVTLTGQCESGFIVRVDESVVTPLAAPGAIGVERSVPSEWR
jgi:hypothetical protein